MWSISEFYVHCLAALLLAAGQHGDVDYNNSPAEVTTLSRAIKCSVANTKVENRTTLPPMRSRVLSYSFIIILKITDTLTSNSSFHFDVLMFRL